VEVEKQETPAKIQEKLDHKNQDSPVSFFRFALFPDQEQGDSHEKVKRCPHRTKYPIGRIKRRLIKRFIP